jgi:hypothetical protein
MKNQRERDDILWNYLEHAFYCEATAFIIGEERLRNIFGRMYFRHLLGKITYYYGWRREGTLDEYKKSLEAKGLRLVKSYPITSTTTPGELFSEIRFDLFGAL